MEKSANATTLLKSLTGITSVKLLPSGDSSIFCFLAIAKQLRKKKLLIPDQGGWMSYKPIAALLGFEVIEFKTDQALINPEQIKNPNKECCLIYHNPGGYFVTQPIERIFEKCRKEKILLCMDISGSIGSRRDLGKWTDFIVGSFGRWKIINVGYGGFIGSNYYQLNEFKKIFRMFKINFHGLNLEEKLNKAEERYKKLHNIAKETAKELLKKGFSVVHPNKIGVNVCVLYKDESELKSIKEFCKEKGFEFVICPFQDRLKEKAVSIEIKRLN